MKVNLLSECCGRVGAADVSKPLFIPRVRNLVCIKVETFDAAGIETKMDSRGSTFSLMKVLILSAAGSLATSTKKDLEDMLPRVLSKFHILLPPRNEIAFSCKATP
jgi:hypothetical protein